MDQSSEEFLLGEIKEEIEDFDSVAMPRSGKMPKDFVVIRDPRMIGTIMSLPLNQVRITTNNVEGQEPTMQETVIPIPCSSIGLSQLLEHSTFNPMNGSSSITMQRGAQQNSSPAPLWTPRIMRIKRNSKVKVSEIVKEKGTENNTNKSDKAPDPPSVPQKARSTEVKVPESSQDLGTIDDSNEPAPEELEPEVPVMKPYNLRKKVARKPQIVESESDDSDLDAMDAEAQQTQEKESEYQAEEEDESSDEECCTSDEEFTPQRWRKQQASSSVRGPYKRREEPEISEPEEEIVETKRGRDMSDGEYRDFMVSSFATLIDLTKQLCRIKVSKQIEKMKLLKAPKPVVDVERREDLIEIDTIEKLRELEKDLKSSIFQEQWVEKIVAHVEAYKTLDCSLAARKIMRLIFSTDVLLRMNFAGNSVYYENGVEEVKFKLANSKLFESLVRIMRKLGFNSFKSIKKELLAAVYKSKGFIPKKKAESENFETAGIEHVLSDTELSEPAQEHVVDNCDTDHPEPAQDHLVDNCDLSMECFDEDLMDSDEGLNRNSEQVQNNVENFEQEVQNIPEVAAEEEVLNTSEVSEVQNTTEISEVQNTTEVLNSTEPMELAQDIPEPIQTENSEQKVFREEMCVGTRKSGRQRKPIKNNDIIPEITTMEELKELENKLHTLAFCKEWVGKIVSQARAFKNLDYKPAARKIMRLIFGTDTLRRMNYAGYSAYCENGVKEVKFKLKNSKIFVALVAIMRKIGFKDFKSIKKGIVDVVYKSKDYAQTVKPANSGPLDHSEPFIKSLEEYLKNSEKVQNSNAEQVQKNTSAPIQQNLDNSKPIQTEKVRTANKGTPVSPKKTDTTRKSANQQCKPVEDKNISKITTMEELKELEKMLNNTSFCKEWMNKVVTKLQHFHEFNPTDDCRDIGRKMMRLIFDPVMFQRINYAGHSRYDAGYGELENKFKLKNSQIFAVLVLIMKKLGFKNFRPVKESILNVVYKSKQIRIRKPEDSDSESSEDGRKSAKKRRGVKKSSKQRKLNNRGQQITEKPTKTPENETFYQLTSIKEVKQLEKDLKSSSYYQKWTDDVVAEMEIYKSRVCPEVARHMMRIVFVPSLWLKMNYAGLSKYDAGDGVMKSKFKLKDSKLFDALVDILMRLGFKKFNVIKKSILDIIYKSKTSVKSVPEVEDANSEAVSEHSKSTKQKTVPKQCKSSEEHSETSEDEHLIQKYRAKKLQSAKQKIVPEHSKSSEEHSDSSDDEDLIYKYRASKCKSVKQKFVNELSEHSDSSEDLDSRYKAMKSKSTKQKIVTEHSEQEGVEEILFGNFELSTSQLNSTVNIPVESSSNNVNFEPDAISSIDQVLTELFENSRDAIVTNIEDTV